MSKAQKPSEGLTGKSAHSARISEIVPLGAQDELPLARRLLGMMGVPEEATPEEMLQDAVTDLNRASYYAVRAGARFLAIKASLKHGAFVPAIEELGIEVRRAQDCMRLARFVAALPEAEASKILSAPKSKLLAITRADPDVVDQLVASGDVSNLAQLSVRELQTHIRKLESKLASETTKRETAEAVTEKIKGRALHRLVDIQLPEFCVVAREESVALTEQMSLSMDGLELLTRDNLLMPHDEVAEGEKFAAMAAGTTFHTLRAIYARAGQLLAQLQDAFPNIDDGARFEHQLKPGEVEAFKHARELILGRIKGAADNRAAERHNAKGGRGRPRDVKKVK